MTNFEHIKGFTMPEMVAFLEEVSATSGSNMTDEACEHCRASFGNCPYGESYERETCRLLENSVTIEYWLNMSHDES